MPRSTVTFRASLSLAVCLTAGATWLAPEVEAHPVTPPLAAAQRATGPVSAMAAPRESAPQGRGLPGPEPGSELRVSLITIGAGPQVWEMFGHNAIRFQDPARGLDVSYNWGMFDFGQEGFFWRFLLGDWRYWMAGLPSEAMIAHYVTSGRGVVEQELELSPAQREMLLTMVELNARPENAFYRYQYFLDNCSTRVRDALDVVLAGSLEERFGEAPGETYRFHTRRLTAGNPLIYVSLDFFMGGRGDRPGTAWEEMFIPMLLRDFLRETDLVTSEAVLDESSRPRPLVAPPPHFIRFTVVGVLLAGLLAGLAALAASKRPGEGGRTTSRAARDTLRRVAKPAFVLAAGIWSLVAGVCGLVMIVSHFTSHEFMHWNENFLQANPLSLVLAGALLSAVFAGRWRRLARRAAVLAAGMSVLGVLIQVVPGIDQVNGYYLVVAVPAHLAVAWGVRAVVRDGGDRESCLIVA